MTTPTDVEVLPQFEDRFLFHLVDLAGAMPLGIHEGVQELAIAGRLASDLGSPKDFTSGEAYHSSPARRTIAAAIKSLRDEGLVEADGYLGGYTTIRPTLRGRRRVEEWRQTWAKQRQQRDTLIQRRILEELDQQRRSNPARYQRQSRIDVPAFCADQNITPAEFLASAQRLEAQRKVSEYLGVDQLTLADGYVAITESGIRALEVSSTASRPTPTAQEAWVEVARLKRELEIARRDLPSLIADGELSASFLKSGRHICA